MNIKKLGVLVFCLGLAIACFGQKPGFLPGREFEDQDIIISPNIKLIKKYTSALGLVGLKPFELTQEVIFDEMGRVMTNLDYTSTASIFGSGSSTIKTDFTYFKSTPQIQAFKKTHTIIVEGKSSERMEGRVFNLEGNMTHVLFYQPSGAVDSIPLQEFNVGASVRNSHQGSNQSYGAIRDQEPFTHYQNANWDYQPGRIKVENTSTNALQKEMILPDNAQYPGQAKKSKKKNDKKDKTSEAKSEIKTVREELVDGYAIKEINERNKEVLSEHRVKLNKHNKPVQVVDFYGPDQVSITSYLYDAAGNEIEVKQVNKKGNVVSKYNHAYDESGLLVESVISQGKDKVLKKVKYEYEFY